MAKAVADKIHEWYPDKEVKIASAEGLANCKKMLMMAKAGKSQRLPCWKAWAARAAASAAPAPSPTPCATAVQLNKYVAAAPFKDPEESAFITNIHLLKDDPDFE